MLHSKSKKSIKNKIILLTGGGSGGHVIPALTVYDYISKLEYDISFLYIGSKNGIERQLAEKMGIPYFAISTGKLRRYMSSENIKDFFSFLQGIIQAFTFLPRKKKIVLFSTGGYVALPVILACWMKRIPIVIHEQTTHVGLANRISAWFAKKICISFASSKQYFPENKTLLVGYPLRSEFCEAKPPMMEKYKNIKLPSSMKVLLVLGGGNGSELLNKFILTNLEILTKEFVVFLQCGSRFEEEMLARESEYFIPFAFMSESLVALMERADCILARSGAGTVCELMSLKKKVLYVPLAIAQKQEQLYNAMEAQKCLGEGLVQIKEETAFKTMPIAEFIYWAKGDSGNGQNTIGLGTSGIASFDGESDPRERIRQEVLSLMNLQ